MSDAAAPDLFLTLAYGNDVAGLFAPGEATARLVAAVERSLAQLLARLGVPATPRLALAPDSSLAGFIVYAEDVPLPLAQPDVSRLLRMYAPSRAAEEAAPFMVAFITRAAEANAAALVGDRQNLRWIERALERRPDAEPIARYAECTRTVLRALLAQGIAITDVDTICRYLLEGLKSRRRTAAIVESAIARLQPATLDIDVSPALAVRLFGGALAQPLPGDDLPEAVKAPFAMLRDGLFYELGVRIPPIRIVPDGELPAGTFRVRSGAVGFTPWPALEPEQLLVGLPDTQLKESGIEAAPAVFPANDGVAAIIPASDRAAVEALGASTWDAIGYLVLAAARDIRTHAGILLDIDAVESALAQLEPAFPELVYAALEKVSATDLTRVLRNLLAGDVSIRNFRSILERLLAYAWVPSDLAREIVFDPRLPIDCRLDPQHDMVDRYTEFVRSGLQMWLSHRSRGANGTLVVRLLDPQTIERPVLEELSYRQATGLGRPLGSARLAAICEAVRAGDEQAALLTVPQVATFLRQALRAEFPRLPVLSYQELAWDVNVQPIARLSI